MPKYIIFDAVTGQIRSHFSGAERQLHLNVPEDCDAIEGDADPLSQRVEPVTRTLIDWQPPQPSADHEWKPEQRRWVKNQRVLDRELIRLDAQARVDELERKMLRPMRELRQDPNDTIAAAKLDELTAEIDALVKELR